MTGTDSDRSILPESVISPTGTPTWRDGRAMNQHAGSSVGPPEPAVRPGAVEIREVKIRDLDSFVRESIAALRPPEVIPISPSRAGAQARNPHADPDDVGLLVAYREGRCVGTLGLVPGLLRAGDRLEKVHWLSAWYVPQEYRNTGGGAVVVPRVGASPEPRGQRLLGTGREGLRGDAVQAPRAAPLPRRRPVSVQRAGPPRYAPWPRLSASSARPGPIPGSVRPSGRPAGEDPALELAIRRDRFRSSSLRRPSCRSDRRAGSRTGRRP